MTSENPVKRRKKLIEVAIPLAEVNDEAARRNTKAPLGWPTSIHKWWAQRPIAIARAVLLAQILDDPSELPDKFPDIDAQSRERERLLGIIASFSDWDNTKNEQTYAAIEEEINAALSRAHVTHDEVRFLDPFAGGACIPISAQLLGLYTEASDLNPISCLINLSLGEIPYRISNHFYSWAKESAMRGIGETAIERFNSRFLYFAEIIKERAFVEAGKCYPALAAVTGSSNSTHTPIAYIWARSVPSPNPAFSHVNVPLASNFVLCNRKGKEIYLQPIVEGDSWKLSIARGAGDAFKKAREGTKIGRGGNFRCLLSGEPISSDYIKECGENGKLSSTLMAVVIDGPAGRDYIEASAFQEEAVNLCPEHDMPKIELPDDPRNFWIAAYGFKTFDSLFSRRQKHILHTLITQINSLDEEIIKDAASQFVPEVSQNGSHITQAEYVRYIKTYLMLVVSRLAYYGSTLNGWLPKDNALGPAMPRQTIPMSWDYAEANPFGKSSGGISACTNVIAKALCACNPRSEYKVLNEPAQSAIEKLKATHRYIISTDPPYYDNIAYADLSDYFYQWLRLGLKNEYPDLFRTLSAPKSVELVATPYRHNGRENAETYFLEGMKEVFGGLSKIAATEFPLTIYYSFKQSESDSDGAARRTGWETFLTAVLDSGLEITATWPLRAERKGRMLAAGTNALASCILLVCRPRDERAGSCTRADFRREARLRIKEHLVISEKLCIPPVDYAQIAVGVGISVYSSYRSVLSVDDTSVAVGAAISDIQAILDDILCGDEGEYDKETQFAVAFYESYGFSSRPYGDAELLAKAKNISVDSVIRAGALGSISGSVFLVRRDQLDIDWNPFADKQLCVWEATQHLIKCLEEGESSASLLLAQLKEVPGHGDLPASCRALSYRLYNHCEKTKQAEEARSYNGLVIAWPELEKLAAAASSSVQPSLL